MSRRRSIRPFGTALVTGSIQGIGAAIATGPARTGARVAVNGRTERRAEESAAHLARSVPGADVVPVAADVAGEEGAARVVDALPRGGHSGQPSRDPRTGGSAGDHRRGTAPSSEVNILAAVRPTRLYLPGMTERGWGRIPYVADDSAVVIPAEMIRYSMSRTALLAVGRGFAKQAAGTGVTVNSAIAGPPRTGGVEDFVYGLVDPGLPWDEPAGLHAGAPAAVPVAAVDRARGDRRQGRPSQFRPDVGHHGGALRADG